MELYHSRMSVCSEKVMLVLREKGLKPIEHHLDLRKGESHTREYHKLNPNGVVPTLVDRGKPIIESTIICEYLDDAYPDPPLRPSDPLHRAEMRMWTQIPDTGLHHACATLSIAIAFGRQIEAQGGAQLKNRPNPVETAHYKSLVRKKLEHPRFPEAVRYYDSVLAKMAHQLESTPWLAGNGYSLADSAMLPYILRLEDLSLGWMWEGARASVADWMDRSKHRKNFSAITDYRDSKYLELMGQAGSDAILRVKSILTE
ncbi:MAG: glutathione S-transferase family protein [Candidatus Binatus sp.]|uniref:glutathione S-transferase family protein n=1 Tax=Candidatus Binatus sp. TaxID=2811406 RepID=UPI003BB1671E